MQEPAVKSVAIVIHAAALNQGQTTMSVVAHDIHVNDRTQQSSLGPGRVFSTRDKQELSSLLSGHMNSSLEMLEPQCLAASHETMMWYRPRQKTLVNIDGKEIEVPLPPLIFLVHKRKLHVVAYKGNKRPTRDTKLFVSGLPNVMGNHGPWCSGGNPVPEHPQQADIENIERRFFLSPFTHWGGAKPSKADEMADWFEQLSQKRSFPMNALPALNRDYMDRQLTLSEWFGTVTQE